MNSLYTNISVMTEKLKKTEEYNTTLLNPSNAILCELNVTFRSKLDFTMNTQNRMDNTRRNISRMNRIRPLNFSFTKSREIFSSCMVIVVAASATIQGKVILVNSVVMIIGNPKKYLLITSVPTTMVRKATNSAQMTLTILSRILKILSISTSTT